MKKLFSFFVCLLISINALYAQDDQVDVFRTPSKNKPGSVASAAVGNNSISVSLAHIGRGGTLLSYERYINNSSFAVTAGIGFSRVDFIGQLSLDEEGFYFESDYATRTGSKLMPVVDFGGKFMFDEELAGNYFGLAYSGYKNLVTQELVNINDFVFGTPESFDLKYSSRDFKIIYGYMNDADSRFFSDFHIGGGFRFIEYQQLNVTDVPVPTNSGYTTEQVAEKKSLDILKPWFFLGWKVGVRF